MSLIRQARAALQAGDDALAIALYMRAMVEQPGLAHLYQPSVDRLRRRQGMIQQGPTTEASDAALALKTAPAHPAPPTLAGGAVMLNTLYQQVARALPSASMPDPNTAPLVSVLMTAHNVADYIEEVVTSVLRQSWPNLELIVVDDASTDATWAILQRLQKTVGNLRCRRLNTNLGTYFAKNDALQLAHGTVQSDDRQSALVRSNGPWGYAAIRQAVEAAGVRAASEEVRERLAGLVPVLHQCLG